jgi:hypothetical protein
MAHLFARYLEILPLFFKPALPMKVLLKIRPYFGVFPLVLRALKRAFSAPRIWIVDAGYFERLVRPPAWAINFEPTISPIRAYKFGATAFIRSLR